MSKYIEIHNKLSQAQNTWLITGVAGFIGSHLAKELLSAKQKVIGLDNFSFGKRRNIASFVDNPDFTLIEGDIRDQGQCLRACKNVDYILHHAAIASVTKSIEEPILADQVNNGGFINILMAAHQQNVKKIIYASSSAIYGDKDERIKRHEGELLAPMSPYAASKCANEHYAQSLAITHNLKTIGLRYFNIYGPCQDLDGAYAAVIPKWINAMLRGQDLTIYGDGSTTRDFCYIDDVVQANILAALNEDERYDNQFYNVAAGQGTTLNELFTMLKEHIDYNLQMTKKPFRKGDIKISRADITKAQDNLQFTPLVSLNEGLEQTVEWYRRQLDAE